MSPTVETEQHAAAPFIHPLNAAKYPAAQVRARSFARTRRHLLLWVVAQDAEVGAGAGSARTVEERTRWLQRHEQETGGVMGLSPLVVGLPIRVTVTDARLKPARVFKNSRGILEGWTLTPEDAAAVSECVASELVLRCLPLCIYVRVPGSSYEGNEQRKPQIVPFQPQAVTWSLDVAGNVKIARRGFALATDLAGTAHSFMGATLASAIVDLGSLWQVPTHDAQLTGYVCASRVRRVTDLVVAHPYSPELFTQGDLTGPKLLLDFQRGHKSVEDVKMAWAQAARAAQNRTRARDWPANLNLICISCAITIETAEEFKRPLWSFRGRGSNDLEIVYKQAYIECAKLAERNHAEERHTNATVQTLRVVSYTTSRGCGPTESLLQQVHRP